MLPLNVLLSMLVLGCGNKTPATTAAPAQAAVKPDTPEDANSEKFATQLLAMNITNFRPMSTGSGRFIYNTLQFQGDNTWRGEGYIEIADERMECVESGTWSMEPAESATISVMTWTVASTDCINQSEGDRRYRVTIQGNDLSVENR
jgi:hypothetical protein